MCEPSDFGCLPPAARLEIARPGFGARGVQYLGTGYGLQVIYHTTDEYPREVRVRLSSAPLGWPHAGRKVIRKSVALIGTGGVLAEAVKYEWED